jgi:hypothetical protein
MLIIRRRSYITRLLIPVSRFSESLPKLSVATGLRGDLGKKCLRDQLVSIDIEQCIPLKEDLARNEKVSLSFRYWLCVTMEVELALVLY